VSINQLAGLIVTLGLAGIGFLKYYIDAKIDPMANDVKMLIQLVMNHEGKIAVLEDWKKRKGE
jgi:hypothetical protein